jgi:hypothetical protein
MTRRADRYPVFNLKSQFRELLPRLQVVRVQFNIACAALCALGRIPADDLLRPSGILAAALGTPARPIGMRFA